MWAMACPQDAAGGACCADMHCHCAKGHCRCAMMRAALLRRHPELAGKAGLGMPGLGLPSGILQVEACGPAAQREAAPAQMPHILPWEIHLPGVPALGNLPRSEPRLNSSDIVPPKPRPD